MCRGQGRCYQCINFISIYLKLKSFEGGVSVYYDEKGKRELFGDKDELWLYVVEQSLGKNFF